MPVLRSANIDRIRRAPARTPMQLSVVSVYDAQRARLLSAALSECAVKGAGGVTVAGIVSSAGVSRRTFYEHFPDAERCVLLVLEESVARASGIVREAYQAHTGWSESVRAGLAALLGWFEEEPEAGRALVVEALCAGPEVLARRTEVLAALASALDEGRAAGRPGAGSRAAAALSPLTAEGMVGAVLSVLHDRLATDPSPRLSDLLNPLMCMIVTPYLGFAAASRELQRPVRTNAASSTRPRRLEQLPMRLTYRTMRVLLAIAGQPGSSNRRIAIAAGIEDQGQASKMLARLERLGLIENNLGGTPKGAANAWRLTRTGRDVARQIAPRARQSEA